jgi:hypothetical protein
MYTVLQTRFPRERAAAVSVNKVARCKSANFRRLSVAPIELDAPQFHGVVEEAAPQMILRKPQCLHLLRRHGAARGWTAGTT